MDEKDLELEETVDEEETEEPEEAEALDESEPEDEAQDTEFEYDENGDIIIPEDEKDEEEGDSEEEEPEKAEMEPVAPERDEEKEALRRKLEEYERQTRDTLKNLGVEEEDGLKGLVKLAAEAEGLTEQEYLAKVEQERRAEQERQARNRSAFEQRMQRDLSEIHAAYPETKRYSSPEEFPNFKRFGQLMDAGATPVEAFVASHPDSIKESAVVSARQSSLNATKQHIRSSVPKGAKRESVHMPKSELRAWREMFPGKSDREIVELYKETM